MATQAQINAIASLYAGYFDRAPDPVGLQFWINQIDNGRAFNTIAADFAAGFEAKALYPFLTSPGIVDPSSFVTSVYNNLFNRGPDAAGLKFWTDVIKAGTVPVGDMIQRIIDGAQDAPTATPPTFDLKIMANKQAVGLDFATKAATKPGFVFDTAAAAAAKAAMDGVTDDVATVATAKAAIDAFIGTVGAPTTGAGIPGEIFTVSSNADNITGTANDDTIRSISTDALSSNDVINGGGGKDTLTISSTGQTPNSSPVIQNVEIINDADVTSSDLSATSGIQQYWSTGSSNIIRNASLDTIFGTKLTASGTISLGFKTSTTGSSDTVKIATMDNVGTTTFTGTDTFAGTSSSVKLGAETLEVSALGGTDGKFGGTGTAADDSVFIGYMADLKVLKVSGTGDIALDGKAVSTTPLGTLKVTNIDTRETTGYTMVDVSDTNTNITANGGNGADDFRLGNGNNTVSSGGGNDIVTTGSGTDMIQTGAGKDILSGGTGTNTLDGGSGADEMVGQGVDTFVITTDDTSIASVDRITGNFTSGSDKLEFGGVAGTTTNYKEATGTVNSYSDALSVANGLLDGTILYATVQNTATGPLQAGIIVFADTNGDGTADHVVNIAGSAGGSYGNIDFGDII